MNVVLINPPSLNLRGIPTGILLLKRYLTENLNQDVKIDLVDFNDKYFDYYYLVKKIKTYCRYCNEKKKCVKRDYLPQGILKLREQIDYCESIIFKDYLRDNARNLKNIDQEVRQLLNSKPSVVGFSVFHSFNNQRAKTSLGQLLFVLAYAKTIKKLSHNIKIILGGPALYSESQNYEIIRYFTFIDIIVQGEGELALNSIIQRIDKQKFQGIANIIWRDGVKIVKNKKNIIEKSICIFPDYSSYNLDLFKTFLAKMVEGILNRQKDNLLLSLTLSKGQFDKEMMLPLKLSYGCPWGRCKFCTFHKFSAYKFKNEQTLVKEINYYINELRVNTFFIIDDEMSSNMFMRFIKLIKNNNWNISYTALARPVKYFTKELLLEIRNSGCRNILWGAETFSRRKLG